MYLFNNGRIISQSGTHDAEDVYLQTYAFFPTKEDAENAVAKYLQSLPDEELATYIASKMLE